METKDMNLYQKLSEISKMCDVLRKDKSGYGFKYVEESSIQALLTAGLQQYGVNLLHDIVPGTLKITPHTYEKYDKASKTTKQVTEFIVTAETRYTWVNVDNPEERINGTYVIVGMQEDPSMAFGSAETYCNRYYLIKSLQIATTEDDPDNWRSKQREAADHEEREKERAAAELLRKSIDEVVSSGTNLMSNGISKETILKIVAKHNKGNSNPSSIESEEVCRAILADFANIEIK